MANSKVEHFIEVSLNAHFMFSLDFVNRR